MSRRLATPHSAVAAPLLRRVRGSEGAAGGRPSALIGPTTVLSSGPRLGSRRRVAAAGPPSAAIQGAAMPPSVASNGNGGRPASPRGGGGGCAAGETSTAPAPPRSVAVVASTRARPRTPDVLR